MPSTARRWHPIQAVNAYAIRLVWLRDHREGTWLTVPWRLLSSTATPFGEPVALSMTRTSVSATRLPLHREPERTVREALPVLDVDGFGQQLGADRKTPRAARPRPGTRALATGAGCGPRPAVAEYRQAPSVLALSLTAAVRDAAVNAGFTAAEPLP